MSRGASPRNGILAGIFRIARGRVDGIACFGSSAQAFLSSLAPLLAFPLVAAVLGLFSEGPRRALTGLAMAVCASLTPAVISYELARVWKRTDAWLRFATAFNWCEWILPVLFCVLVVPISVAISLGLSEDTAQRVLFGCLGVYALWLHWFLARNGLALSRWRAGVLVVLVNLGTAVAVIGPTLLVSEAG
ncbi:MAG TPA: hypothetical protein VHU42_18285 [Rhodopila sp.]|jgi:hypothetical protein|nr:hypothetical protein [Rhodopila sp.]